MPCLIYKTQFPSYKIVNKKLYRNLKRLAAKKIFSHAVDQIDFQVLSFHILAFYRAHDLSLFFLKVAYYHFIKIPAYNFLNICDLLVFKEI